MDGILNFLADYYILFIILSVILLFALIGFIVGERKKNKAGVQTASATDLPINNTDTPVQNPDVTIAPEAPVMMSEPVNSEVVQMEVPGVNETEVSNEPTLVIDEPVNQTNTVVAEETPVMMNEPVQMDSQIVNESPALESEVSNEPTLVIDEPAQNENMPIDEPVQMETLAGNEIETPDMVVPTIPEVEVQNESMVTNNVEDVSPIIPSVEFELPAQDNTVLEPTIENVDVPNVEPSLVMPEPTQNEQVLEPTMEQQNTSENSIFENPDMTGTTSIFENEVNNQNN